MKEMANVLLAIYVWAPLMLLALGAVCTLLIFGAWKITTAIQHIANKCYGKITCKNSVNDKDKK